VYLCIGKLKRAFLEGYRRVISIDGSFLKAQRNGHLSIAVGRDENDIMYPFAWVLGQTENNEMRTWFDRLRKNDLQISTSVGRAIVSK